MDANNDTNTEVDRQTIQKEIYQGYDQINDIAIDTEYNTKKILLGNLVEETVKGWEVLRDPILVEDSDSLNMIPDKYDTLNGKQGPFDVFKKGAPIVQGSSGTSSSPLISTMSTNAVTTNAASGAEAADITPLGIKGTPENFGNATPATQATWTIDLGQVGLGGGSLPDALDKKGFSYYGGYTTYTFALTTNPSGVSWPSYVNKIDISGARTMTEIASRIASAINNHYDYTSVEADGAKLKFTSNEKGSYVKAQNFPMNDASRAATPATTTTVSGDPIYKTITVGATGKLKGGEQLSGGEDPHGTPGDKDYSPGSKASGSVDMSGAQPGTAFTIGGERVSFVEGSGFNRVYDHEHGGYVNEVGVDFNGTFTTWNDIAVTVSGGKMDMQARFPGSAYNYQLKDGGSPYKIIDSYGPDKEVPVPAYDEITGLGVPAQTDVVNGTDGEPASYTVDLTDYSKPSDSSKLEEFIKGAAGNKIYLTSYGYEYSYKLYDSKSDSIENVPQNGYAGYDVNVDLDKLRDRVAAGETIAQAFVEIMQKPTTYSGEPAQVTNNYSHKLSPVYASDGKTVTGLKFTSQRQGTDGESDTISGTKDSMYQYPLDFGKLLSEKGVSGADIPEKLDYKGLRVYCATCLNQWFNFEFVNGTDSMDDKPKSGVGDNDIKSIIIDISGVDSPEKLVDAMYEQGMPQLKNLDHNLYLAKNDANPGEIIIYDNRNRDL